LNYTPEETLFMVEAYTAEPNRETVEKLAEKLEKSIKSIIGKLSREGVYQRAAYKSKSGDDPVTKMELVNNVAENLGIEIDDLFGLDKSPKAALKALELATGSLKWKER
jgi:lysyl-tRNA synthetase class II